MSVDYREVSDRVATRMEGLRDSSFDSVKEMARHIEHAVSGWDVYAMINQEIKKFTGKVQEEFKEGPAKEVAEIMLSAFQREFRNPNLLKNEIVRILGPHFNENL